MTPTSSDPRASLAAMPSDLAASVLLNRTVYGGEFYLDNAFRADFDPALDPPQGGEGNLRSDLNVYDRYDAYLAPLGFQTLDAEDLGFGPDETAAGATSADDLNVFYRGGLFRNNYQQLPDGELVRIPDAGAVALATLSDNSDGKTLNLTLRGTDADFGADGEAGTGPGQVRYYGQLQPLIDKLYAYAADPGNDVTRVVVSGQSLGGTAADLFTLYDGARFEALPGVDLAVISISSAGVDPVTLDLKPGFDPTLVERDGGSVAIAAPDYYTQFTHDQDFVYFPERYDVERHAAEDPLIPAVFTAGALAGLEDAAHIGGDDGNAARIELETPLVPVYPLTGAFETFFLPPHYMDLYELNGRNLAQAIGAAGRSDFDRFIALNGRNAATATVESTNTVNGWDLPDDDRFDLSDETGDVLVLGLSGDDLVRLGRGDDFFAGGAGDDTLDLAGYARGALADLETGVSQAIFGPGGRDGVSGVENVAGATGADLLRGDADANRLDGRGGQDALRGRAGDDALFGGAGRDALFGGNGADRLDGGAGEDAYFGGRGADTFVFGADALDRAFDFQLDRDVLDLSGWDAASIDALTFDPAARGFAATISDDAGNSARLWSEDGGLTNSALAGQSFVFDDIVA